MTAVVQVDEAARWRAVAALYHHYFTGLILTVANRRGGTDAGEWMLRIFRHQHHEKFLPGLRKLGLAGLPESAKGPAFAVAAGLLVYPQAAHLEHFEPRRTRQLMTGTGGYMARVGRWLRESF